MTKTKSKHEPNHKAKLSKNKKLSNKIEKLITCNLS